MLEAGDSGALIFTDKERDQANGAAGGFLVEHILVDLGSSVSPGGTPFLCAVSPVVFVINRICRLTVKRKGMEVSMSTRDQPAPVMSMSL